jgi:hypothetical protein
MWSLSLPLLQPIAGAFSQECLFSPFFAAALCLLVSFLLLVVIACVLLFMMSPIFSVRTMNFCRARNDVPAARHCVFFAKYATAWTGFFFFFYTVRWSD